MARVLGRTLVVTCEHATHAVPRELRHLGLAPADRRRHVAWDPGALPVARVVAKAFGARSFVGEVSRLVVDLNRSEDHPQLMARRSAGVRVRGNEGIDDSERERRLARYWRPFRSRVSSAVARACARGGCLHLSVHSFVERLHGVERVHDVGLLFDPRVPHERELVERLQRALSDHGLSVRKNFPYFGHTDGHTTSLRRVHPGTHYAGIEIELNQRVVRSAAGQRRVAAALVASLRACDGVRPRARA